MRILLMVMAMACSLLLAEASLAGEKVNINTASVKELQSVKGMEKPYL